MVVSCCDAHKTAVPEHLRAATPLETQIYDVIVPGSQQAPSVVPPQAKKRLGRHHVELVEPPTDKERMDAYEEIQEQPDKPPPKNISTCTTEFSR